MKYKVQNSQSLNTLQWFTEARSFTKIRRSIIDIPVVIGTKTKTKVSSFKLA